MHFISASEYLFFYLSDYKFLNGEKFFIVQNTKKGRSS